MALIFSWLSPSHRPSATIFDRYVYVFNGWDRGRVWNGISPTDHPVGIDGPPLTWAPTPALAAGVSDVGTHRFRYRYYDVDRDNFSPPSNAVSIVVAGGSESLTFPTTGGVEINQSADTRVDFVILEVTAVDGTEFFEAARVANDLTNPVFNLPDIELQEFDLTWPIEVGTVPPPLFRFAVRFRARIWGAGQVVHADGLATVTNASTAVTGVGTNWSTYGLEGRYLQVLGAQSRIVSVTSPTALTVEDPWPGVTSPVGGEAYRIYDDNDLLFWSEANYPEVWFGTNSISTSASITGLATYGSDLLIFTQGGLDRLTYTDDPQGGVRREVPGNRGALTHNAIVQAEGVVYAMDARGIYAYQGSDPVHISRQIDLAILGFVDTSVAAADKIFAVWYPRPRVIRWYYKAVNDPLPEPTRYVEWDIARKLWSLGQLDIPFTGGEGYEDRVTAVPFIGDENGYTWFDDAGSSAGGTTSSPARLTVLAGSVPTATFVPLEPGQLGVFDQLDGVMVRNVDNFTAVVSFNDASSLTMVSPGFATPPAAGDELLVGRLVSRLRTRAHYMDGSWSTRKRGVYLWIHFDPQTQGEIRVRFYRNLDGDPWRDYPAVDSAAGRLEEEGVIAPAFNGSDFVVALTKGDGVVKVPVGAGPFRVIQAEIEVVEPQSRLALYGYRFTTAEGRETRA